MVILFYTRHWGFKNRSPGNHSFIFATLEVPVFCQFFDFLFTSLATGMHVTVRTGIAFYIFFKYGPPFSKPHIYQMDVSFIAYLFTGKTCYINSKYRGETWFRCHLALSLLPHPSRIGDKINVVFNQCINVSCHLRKYKPYCG